MFRWLLVLGLVLVGCAETPTPTYPIPYLRYESGPRPPTTAVVLFPGRWSRAADFAKEGFVRAVVERKLALELIAVDVHLGYYVQHRYRSLPDHLQREIVAPALARGRRRVWLVGTSLGALGALGYADRYPEVVAGVVLLGPYLGEPPMVDALERAGGLAAWQPGSPGGYDYEKDVWRWLQRHAGPTSPGLPVLYLGYGEADRFLRSSRLLGTALPPSRVLIDPKGGHDWATWLRLWTRLLDRHGHELEGG